MAMASSSTGSSSEQQQRSRKRRSPDDDIKVSATLMKAMCLDNCPAALHAVHKRTLDLLFRGAAAAAAQARSAQDQDQGVPPPSSGAQPAAAPNASPSTDQVPCAHCRQPAFSSRPDIASAHQSPSRCGACDRHVCRQCLRGACEGCGVPTCVQCAVMDYSDARDRQVCWDCARSGTWR